MRHGYGTLSARDESGQYVKKYSGGWKNDKRHVRPKNIMSTISIGFCFYSRVMEQISMVSQSTMRVSGRLVREEAGAGCTTEMGQCMRESG